MLQDKASSSTLQKELRCTQSPTCVSYFQLHVSNVTNCQKSRKKNVWAHRTGPNAFDTFFLYENSTTVAASSVLHWCLQDLNILIQSTWFTPFTYWESIFWLSKERHCFYIILLYLRLIRETLRNLTNTAGENSKFYRFDLFFFNYMITWVSKTIVRQNAVMWGYTLWEEMQKHNNKDISIVHYYVIMWDIN